MYGNLLYLIATKIDNVKDMYEFMHVNKVVKYYCRQRDIEKRTKEIKIKLRVKEIVKINHKYINNICSYYPRDYSYKIKGDHIYIRTDYSRWYL